MGAIWAPPVGCTQFPIVQLPLCSGHGICVLGINETRIYEPNVPNSKCVCDPGWSGFGDLVSMATHDCSINTVAIITCWSFTIATSFIALIGILYKLGQSVKRFYEFRHLESVEDGSTSSDHPPTSGQQDASPRMSSPAKKKDHLGETITWREWFQWQVVRICLGSLIPTIGWLMVSVYRVLYPERGIGIDFGMTTLFFWAGGVPFWIAYRLTTHSWLKFRKKLIDFTADDQRKAEEATTRLQMRSRLALICLFVSGVFTSASCWAHQYANTFIFFSYHFAILQLILECPAFLQCAHTIADILTQGLKSLPPDAQVEREKALRRIRALIKEERQLLHGTVTLDVLLAWWPWFRTVSSYTYFQLFIANLALLARVWILKPPELPITPSTSKEGSKTPQGSPIPKNQEQKYSPEKQSPPAEIAGSLSQVEIEMGPPASTADLPSPSWRPGSVESDNGSISPPRGEDIGIQEELSLDLHDPLAVSTSSFHFPTEQAESVPIFSPYG